MTTSSAGPGIGDSANRFSRVMGISFRPWSGESPASLVIRGIIQVALCGFFLWFAVRLATGDELTEVAGELASLRLLGGLIMIAAMVLALMGLIRIGIGVIDFLSSREVTGIVLSVRDRLALDFLPHPVLELIYHRNPHKIDTRKRRTEVVLQTNTGVRQWTVRRNRVARDLRRGSEIRMTVTPLAGHVSAVAPLAPLAPPVR